MEIKRTTEISVETSRRFVIRQTRDAAPVFCPACGEPMLAAEQIAEMLKVSRRAIYQIVEAGAAHFIEIETGAVMICLASLQAIPDGGEKLLPAEAADFSE